MSGLILPRRFNQQPQSGPLNLAYPIKALFNASTFGQQGQVELITGAEWQRQATAEGIGLQGGYVASAGAAFQDSNNAGNLQAACNTQHIVFVVLSNAAVEGIASVGVSATDASPRFILQNNAGTLRVFDGSLGYTNMGAAVIGQRYVFSTVYSDFAPYTTSYYLNGVLVASLNGYRLVGSQRVWVGTGYPAASVNAAVLLYVGREGIAETAAEVARFAANPWQLFQAPPRRLWAVSAGGTNTAIDPGIGALALTGYAATIAQTANQSLTPGVGSVGITGYAPAISQPQAIMAGVGTIALTGYAPSVTQGITTSVLPGVGSLTISGYAPGVAQSVNQSAAPDAGLLALTGYAPALAQTANQAILPGAGVMVVTGYAPTVTQQSASPNLIPAAGQITITGYAPSIAQSGSQESGGFFEVPQVRRRRSIKEERERLGIIPRAVKQVLQAVARASVVADKTDAQAEHQLAQRLAQQDIEAKARYVEFMQQERDRILTRDIDRALRIRQRQIELEEDDRDAEMLLM